MSLIRRNNPRGASINRSHPAAFNIQLLAVSRGEKMVDIVRRQTGTNSGTVAAASDPIIGTATNINASNAKVAFSGRPTANYNTVTWAGLIKMTATSASAQVIGQDGATVNTTGSQLGLGVNIARFRCNSTTVASATMTLVAGDLYFVAASTAPASSGNLSNIVIRRLNGNDIAYGSGNFSTAMTPGGTINVGDNGGTFFLHGDAAFVLQSYTYLNLKQLLAWARDPWSIFSRGDDFREFAPAPAGGGSDPPFIPLNFDNPQRARLPLQTTLLGSPGLLNLLIGQDQLPARWTEFPNPKGPRQPVQTQPVGSPRLLNVLIGLDQLPARWTEFPNPRGPKQPTQTQPVGTFAGLFPVTGVPFYQINWPNPLKPRQPIQTQPLGAFTGLFPVNVQPFNKLDWPNPLKPRQPVQTQPLGTVTLRFPAPGPAPFYKTDWPNPKGPRQPSQTQPLGTLAFRFPAEEIIVQVTGIQVRGYVGGVLVYSTTHPCTNDPDWQGTGACANPGWQAVDEDETTTWNVIPT